MEYLHVDELDALIKNLVTKRKNKYQIRFTSKFIGKRDFEVYFQICKQTRINWTNSGVFRLEEIKNGGYGYKISEIKKLINMNNYVKVSDKKNEALIRNKIEEVLAEFEESRLPVLLTQKELADYLGICNKTLYSMLKQDKFKPIIIGGKYKYFRADDIFLNN